MSSSQPAPTSPRRTLLVFCDSLSYYGPTGGLPADDPRIWPNIVASQLNWDVELIGRIGWTCRDVWWAAIGDPRAWASLPRAGAVIFATSGMDSLPSPLPTAVRELIRYVRPPWLRRWARDGYGWLQPRLSAVARPALPPHLSVDYLEQTRAAIDFNRPGIPVVASIPSVHIAETYGKSHRWRDATVLAITEWGRQHDVPIVDLKAAVGDEVMSGPWQSRRDSLELRGPPCGGRSDDEGPRGGGRDHRGLWRLSVAVRVVTDSSARLSPEELQRWGIRQVPLHVMMDGVDLRDGVDEVPHDVHAHAHVTTAGAAPADLAGSYRDALADSGGSGVVAVHLSAALSSTFSSAVGAAREFGPAVRVVNSRSAAAGVGFVAVAAARSAAAGDDVDTVEAAARAAIPRGHAFIVVDRLDNLRRSGRIGTAASWLGTALSLKPLLHVDVDGRLVLSQRIRTVSKAHVALIEAVTDVVGDRFAAVAVLHVDNHDDADEIGAALTARLPQVGSISIADMGPVLSVHVGAGAIGVCVSVQD